MIETHRLKNVVIFIQTILSFVLSRKIQYLLFILFGSLLLFKILIVTTVEVYKFHALINGNKEKTLQLIYNVITSNC